MSEFVTSSAFFGVAVSLGAYWLGTLLKKKTGLALCNPLLIAILLTIGLLLVLGVDYETYNAGAKYLGWLLTTATVCLAIPLYEQWTLLKQNARAVLLGILAGVLANALCILAMAMLFRLDHSAYVTLLPKSVTTAIGMEVSRELGGYVPITVVCILITGTSGNLLAELFCRVFRITEPIARGVACGTSAHAIGTAKAMEMGRVEGAMSSLSIAVAGILTVIGANVFAMLW